MNTNINRFEPAFDFTACGSSVLLHRGPAEITIDGNTYTGDGEVRLDLVPTAGVHFYGAFQGVLPSTKITLFRVNERNIEGFWVNIGGDVVALRTTVKWCPTSEPIIGIGIDSTQMTRVVFHLFNFVDFFGTRRSSEQSGNMTHAIEHVDLSSDGWQVELKSLPETRSNIERLKAEGGYRLTHIGCIERIDRSSFSAKEAQEYLSALGFFLSFVKGGWCEPVCAVGFDASGNRVWESWSSPREPWYTPLSWFDPHNSLQLATLFSGFMTRWTDDNWREALHEVIYWYLNANHSSRGIDAGIILTQAAIERLSYELAVKDRRLITIDGFKALRASDKFRLLFSTVGILLDIPAETPELQRLANTSQINWLDAPHALTEIRNSLVHPEHKRRVQFGNAYYEAWNLGLWYLEMSILAVCGYSGTYGNRLKQRALGQTENVPWV